MTELSSLVDLEVALDQTGVSKEMFGSRICLEIGNETVDPVDLRTFRRIVFTDCTSGNIFKSISVPTRSMSDATRAFRDTVLECHSQGWLGVKNY
jgi:hypothetical protein